MNPANDHDEGILGLFGSYFDTDRPRASGHLLQPPWTAPQLEDALGTRFVEQILPHTTNDYYVQEKLDGQMLIYTGKYALTKQGNAYQKIPQDFIKLALPPGVPLIGELFRGPGWGHESLVGADRTPSASLEQLEQHEVDEWDEFTPVPTSHRNTRESGEVHKGKWLLSKYVVFDIPGLTKTPYTERHKVLATFVREWNRRLLANDHEKRLGGDSRNLPLQCIRTYHAVHWLHMLKEVIEQPVVRAFPPWGGGDELVAADVHNPLPTHQRVCMADLPGVMRPDPNNPPSLFSPAGEGLVFHHKNGFWRGRESRRPRGSLPIGIKLKPRILLPARVVSSEVSMWGERSRSHTDKKHVMGYKVRVAYYHPGRRNVSEAFALVVAHAGVTPNSVQQTFAKNRHIFLSTYGMTFSTGNLRAHPIACSSLLSWQVRGLMDALKSSQSLGLSLQDRQTLLRTLGWDSISTPPRPVQTLTPAHVQTELLAHMCRCATALPLHPHGDWLFERLLYTTHTHQSVQRRYLSTAPGYLELVNRLPQYSSTLVPGGPVVVDQQQYVPNALQPPPPKTTLGHFVRVMKLTARFVDTTQNGVSTLLRPIFDHGGGILTVNPNDLVTRYCGVTATDTQQHSVVLAGMGAYICLCQRMVLTCCARVWQEIEGSIGPNVDNFFENVVHAAAEKAVTAWNNWLTMYLTVWGFQTPIKERHRFRRKRSTNQPDIPQTNNVEVDSNRSRRWIVDDYGNRVPDEGPGFLDVILGSLTSVTGGPWHLTQSQCTALEQAMPHAYKACPSLFVQAFNAQEMIMNHSLLPIVPRETKPHSMAHSSNSVVAHDIIQDLLNLDRGV